MRALEPAQGGVLLKCCLDCRLIPVVLAVTRVSGVGEDSTFLGSMEVRPNPSLGHQRVPDLMQPVCLQEVPMSASVATVWVLPSGNIMSCCSTFTVTSTAQIGQHHLGASLCGPNAHLLA